MLLSRTQLARLRIARDRLHDLDDIASVGALAEQLGLSPFQLIRQFQAVFGQTPHQARIDARISRAKDLLAAGQPVTRVCMDVGFASLGSFSSSFSRRVGASPSAYRAHVQRIFQVPGGLSTRVDHAALGCFDMLGFLPAAAFAISEKPRLPTSGTLVINKE
ncbi:MAG: AraC family transcriptional regulator [Polyangiales bacterium]